MTPLEEIRASMREHLLTMPPRSLPRIEYLVWVLDAYNLQDAAEILANETHGLYAVVGAAALVVSLPDIPNLLALREALARLAER